MAGLMGAVSPSDIMTAAGVCVNQADWPWWVDRCVAWIKTVAWVNEGTGAAGRMYKNTMKAVLDFTTPYFEYDEKTGKRTTVHGPEAVYAVARDYERQLSAESMR